VKYLIWAGIFLLAVGMQGSFSVFDVTPNFTAILACYAGIRQGEVKGLLIGSLIGIMEDSLSGSLLGPHLLSKGLTGYVAAYLSGKFFGWTPVLGVLVVMALTVADGILTFGARSIFGTPPTGIGAAIFIVAMQSLFNAPFGFFLKKKSEP
jgi:rod shape-determining protein MreD